MNVSGKSLVLLVSRICFYVSTQSQMFLFIVYAGKNIKYSDGRHFLQTTLRLGVR